MKTILIYHRIYRFIIGGIFLLALSIFSSAATITSSVAGGNWSATSTWIGGTVPAATDNVIINSSVYVNGTYTCSNLTVNTGAALYNTYAYSPTLSITNSVINNGSILNNPSGYSFTLDIGGNITNNNVWNISYTQLSGSANQYVQEATGMKLEGYFGETDSIGDIILNSDVLWSANTFDLNRTKIKTNGHRLLTLNYTLKNGYIESNDTLKIDQTSINGLTFTGNYVFDGNIHSQNNNICYGILTVVDTLYNQYAFSNTFTIKGNIINKGAIISNPSGYSFYLDIDGNITNQGIWRVSNTYISGTANHNIQQSAGMAFEGPVTLTDSIGDLNLNSDVRMISNVFDLGKTILRTNGYKLITKDEMVRNGWIISYDTIQLDNTYIEYLSFFGDYKLDGNILSQYANIFNDNATIVDTLVDRYGWSNTIVVNGNITNKGFIGNNSGYVLNLDIKGNLRNEGIWDAYVTNFIGTSNQTMSQISGKKFQGTFNNSDSIGDMILTSDVSFEGNTWNLNNTKIITNGFDIYSNNYTFNDGKISGSDTLIINNSIIQNMRFFGNYKLGGNVLSQSANVFNDTVTIIDTLYNKYGWSNTIAVNGNIINNGTIISNIYTLTLDIKGNITNHGIWNPYITNLVGVTNQTIQQTNGVRFEGTFNNTDSIGDIILGSNIMMENNIWNFNNATLRTNGFQLLSKNHTFNYGKIISNDTSILENSTIVDMRFFGDYILGGNLYSKSGNAFNGKVTIIDTLFNNYGWSNTITINGDIVNKGTIRSNPSGYSLRLDITGNVRNEGLWILETTNFTSINNQQIEQALGKKFEGTFNTTDSIGNIIFTSDVMLESNTWYLNRSKIITNGHKLLSNNYTLTNGKIFSNDTLSLNNSIIEYMDFSGHCKLNGNVYSKQYNTFSDTLTVLDTLTNLYGWSNTIIINGDLINWGSVINNPSGYSLYLTIKGNINNNYIFSTSNISLVGTNARNIGGSNAVGILSNIYVDDSIRLVGNNTLPNLNFTTNSKAWCIVDTGATLSLPSISNASRLLNYGKVIVSQGFDNSVSNNLYFYDASANIKAGVSITKIMVDHYGYQQHPTASGAVSSWWRLRNIPQSYSDSLVWLKLNYKVNALNGNLEDSLKVFFSSNAGLTWMRITTGVSIDKTSKTITILKAPAYGHYILSATSIGINSFHPMIETVEPRSGGNTGYVSMYIFGAGLKSNSVAKLKMTGESDIIADTSYLTDWIGESMLARFNLKGKTLGSYDVVIETPGEATLTKPAYFAITQGQRSNPWVSLTGRDRFLLNRWQTFDLNFGNTSNSDAIGTVLIYVVSDLPGLSVRFPDTKIVLPKSISSLGATYTKIVDSVSIYFVTDTLSGYIGQKMRVYPFYLPLIPAGSAFDARVQVQLTGTGALKMGAWMIDPFWETINYNSKTTEPMPMEVRACITFYAEKYAVQQLTGGLPVLSCLGVVDKLFPPDNYLPDYMIPEEKPYTWGSFIWDFTSAGLSMGQCVTGFVPGVGTAVSYGLSVVGGIMDLKENSDINEGCWRKFKKKSETKKNSNGVTSMDPNEMVGPQGYTSNNYITAKGNKSYRIYFENKASAGSSALEVFVKDTLDKSKFDLSTFSFNSISFGDTTVMIQEFAKKYTVLVDLFPKKKIIVQAHGEIDTSNGAISWSFHSLDRTTLELTEDPDLGFLPPNKISPEGEGNIAYSCMLVKSIPHNATISNKASIVFDLNSPIVTNTYTNKIDTMVPVSSVASLGAKQTDTLFNVSWSGSDQGCGIVNYSIFYSENDSPYVVWKSATSSTNAQFHGKKGATYKFFCIASDSLGLTEAHKLSPEATTRVSVGLNSMDEIISSLHIFPNPTKGLVNIEMNLLEPGTFKVSIVDLTGRVIHSEIHVQENKGVVKWNIPTSDLPEGIYRISITNNRMSISQPLMIIK